MKSAVFGVLAALISLAADGAAQAGEVATLTNGQGDGRAMVTVDGYGTFYGGAPYDPAGPIGETFTTYKSSLFFGGEQNFFGGFPSTPAIEQLARDFAVSSFRVGDRFEVRLTQMLFDARPTGSTLLQTYTIKNLTTTTQTVNIVRRFDGDLAFSGRVDDDRGQTLSGGAALAQFEDGPGSAAHSVTIDADDRRGSRNTGFVIDRGDLDSSIIIAGGIPATYNRRVYDDGNGDGITDTGADLNLYIQRTVTILDGMSADYNTYTRFASGSDAGRLRDLAGCVDLHGQPLRGKTVVARQNNEPAKSVRTDAAGCFRFENMATSKATTLDIDGGTSVP